MFQMRVRGRKGAPSMSFDTREVFHAGKISFSFPPSLKTRSATSKISFVKEYSVLPRLEACAASDCAVLDSTYTSCFVIDPICRLVPPGTLSDRILSPCTRSDSFRTRWWSVFVGPSTGGGPAARHGGGLQDQRDEVVRPIVPLDREFEGTDERAPPKANTHRLLREELVHVGGDALVSLCPPEDEDAGRRDAGRQGGVFDGGLQRLQIGEGWRVVERLHEDREAGRAQGDRPPEEGWRLAHVRIERICEAALAREEGGDRDGARDGHEAAHVRTRRAEVGEDPLDRVLPLGHEDHRVCLPYTLDHPVPEGEVVEERPEVLHQFQDDEPQDEQRDQDDADEKKSRSSQTDTKTRTYRSIRRIFGVWRSTDSARSKIAAMGSSTARASRVGGSRSTRNHQFRDI